MKEKARNRINRSSADKGTRGQNGPLWLWGTHAVSAAIANPMRKRQRLVATKNAAERLGLENVVLATSKELSALLPAGAVHQGAALLSNALKPSSLEDVIAAAPSRIAVLDQVEDPHNLGAIFRSAAAFGVEALVMQTRHAPLITGIVAKSAAGTVERVTECRVVNIARALDTLADAGYLTVGLAGGGDRNLAEAIAGETKLALVLGAEGAGLRPAVANACQVVAKISIMAEIEVSMFPTQQQLLFMKQRAAYFRPIDNLIL